MARPLLRTLFALAATTSSLAFATGSANGQSPLPTNDPLLTTTDGTRTLTVSKSQDLDGNGDTVIVEGSGYDVTKGIYIGLCVKPTPGGAPSPCGGGADRAGTGGASVWISSNPPGYGTKLAIPYGPGGSFRVEFGVGPAINDVIDCRAVECAIVSKNDHTIYDDRSQDLVIPVTFTGDAPATTIPASTEVAATTEAVTEITVDDNMGELTAIATGREDRSNVGVIVFFGAVAVVILGGAILLARARKNRGS
ncbi:MAG: hypothetical protein B7C54_05615 [Acidimicrobiales bacterium mtb01]|nr:hypothetical protein [Actinomycetota bacterium]TEX46677.1 MAG: hypothetical protein B7C54_05615 [Acidimicrobiales bacterium mtb01]